MAIIIDGKQLAQQKKAELKNKVSAFSQKYGRNVTLAVVLIGNNPASQVYVRNKIKDCEEVGIKSLSYCLPEETTENQAVELVKSLAKDKSVDGIMVQLPLPKHINEEKVLSLIPSDKDVDGFSDENIGKLYKGKPTVVACTPYGVLQMIKSVNYKISGKNAVVLGRSNIVGKPMASLLLNENATVTICHSKTENLKEVCKSADILVVAIGKPNFVKADMVKNGAIVIDVGINRAETGLVGDVDFESVKKVAGYISPVPGGVGPMTRAMLLESAYNIAVKRENDGI